MFHPEDILMSAICIKEALTFQISTVFERYKLTRLMISQPTDNLRRVILHKSNEERQCKWLSLYFFKKTKEASERGIKFFLHYSVSSVHRNTLRKRKQPNISQSSQTWGSTPMWTSSSMATSTEEDAGGLPCGEELSPPWCLDLSSPASSRNLSCFQRSSWRTSGPRLLERGDESGLQLAREWSKRWKQLYCFKPKYENIPTPKIFEIECNQILK